MARGEVGAHEFSAKIESVERATNGIHINFTVTGDPDFIDIEGSPTLTGIYREEQDVEMDESSPGHMRALIPVSTEDRFFRVRLMPANITNTLTLPVEAQNVFGDAWIPGFDRTPFQQIYAGSEFSDAPADVVEIHGLAWRLDEAASSLNTTVSRLVIKMGILTGDISKLPSRGFQLWDQGSTVFDEENVNLRATAGLPAGTFDIQIQFDQTYRYDRRAGNLVLFVEDTLESDGRNIDSTRVSVERGRLYRDDFPNSPYGTSSMIVTKFFFSSIEEP